MTTILAHRANLSGPHSVPENSHEACARALAEGFGLETDLRRDPSGNFYISHDPGVCNAENNLPAFTELFRRHPAAELAINVKELGYEADLITLMNSGQLGQRSFFFDFELLEPPTPGAAQRKIRSLAGGKSVRLASRLSDRNEPLSRCLDIPAQIVWGDEFDSLWMSEREVRDVRAAGRTLYMISPEIHGFSPVDMKRRWQDFKNWSVDGICTDFPLAAREFFGG